MTSFLIHVWSFFIKEIHDVRRQPRLMLSLVGGPLLVLAVFGATFRTSIPRVSVVLVWPEGSLTWVNRQEVAKLINRNFQLHSIVDDLDTAMLMLERGQVDMVQVMPSDPAANPAAQTEEDGRPLRPELQVFSRALDPATESWIRSLSYRERTYLNQLLVMEQVTRAQGQSDEVQAFLGSAQQDLASLSEMYNAENERTALEATAKTRRLLRGLLALLPPPPEAGGTELSPELSQLYRDVQHMLADLDALEQVLRSGELSEKIDRVNQSISEIGDLDEALRQFKAIHPEEIASPVKEVYTNLRGGAYELVVYFAPAVLAMLVQHLGVTLAALAFVRERQMGAFEMFRVAPLNMLEIILGKTLAYTTYVTIAGAALSVLLLLLNVPPPQNALLYAALLVLVALASVGIGFVISAVSTTDSQAVQWTMLTLLLSIFFSGFFLPITGFLAPAKLVTYSLPMTYAISGFQSLLLSGTNPSALTWLGLLGISVTAFVLVSWATHRVSRKVL